MYRIFGPPGTGKTTRLLGMVDEALGKGTPPSSIAFLAFTKKAATEAKERAMDRFSLKENDLPYFRTIHSLAYQMVGMKSEQMIQAEHFKELASYIGIDLNTTSDALTEEDMGMRGSQHPILSLINLARLRKISLWEAYNETEIDEKWAVIEYTSTAYNKFKEINHLYDFTDLLELFIDEGYHYCPNFSLCFLDEAQDLSPLQWDIAHILDGKSERMYAAGDDDQAIYRWNGADVEHFIHLDGPSEVLEQSYRVPLSIHQYAESISNRIHSRYTKSYGYKPNTVGSVNHVETMTGIDMSTGTWLVLAQTRYMLEEPKQALQSMGYLFRYHNGKRSVSEKISLAINGWTQLSKGNRIAADTAKAIYSYISGNDSGIAKGYKKYAFDDSRTYSYDDLVKECGLIVDKSMIWHEAMDKLPKVDRAYITAALRRGEKFNATPRITLSTIHGSKGGEADGVILYTDLSWAAIKNTQSQQAVDDLLRVFYVAVTRAKNALFLVAPEEFERSFFGI